MRPIRYALWSLLTIIPLISVLGLLASAMIDAPGLKPIDMGPMTSVLSIAAFLLTAIIAPGVADPEREDLPGWSAASIIACIVQIVALIVVYAGGPASAWSAAYVPGIVVTLNLTALILVHVWVACEGFGFPLAVGFGLGGACAGWIIRAGASTEFGVFHAVSAIVLGAGFAAGIVCALADESRPARAGN